MYAGSPEALESFFSKLELLREFILEESMRPGTWAPVNRYGEFCSDNDLGAGLFSQRMMESDSHVYEPDVDQHWGKLTEFLRLYLRETRPDFDPDDPEIKERMFPI